MNELKSCPFCGKEPHIDANYHLFSCQNKDCIADATNYEATMGFFEQWNTRPIEDALNARIAELETEKECEMRVFKDGNAWCFVLPDFQDLQVSSSVWMKEGVLDKIYKELRSVRDERIS